MVAGVMLAANFSCGSDDGCEGNQSSLPLAGFYSSASAASSISPVLAEWMHSVGIPYSGQIAHNGVTLILMFFNLVFGELVPKRIALQKAEAFSVVILYKAGSEDPSYEDRRPGGGCDGGRDQSTPQNGE